MYMNTEERRKNRSQHKKKKIAEKPQIRNTLWGDKPRTMSTTGRGIVTSQCCSAGNCTTTMCKNDELEDREQVTKTRIGEDP